MLVGAGGGLERNPACWVQCLRTPPKTITATITRQFSLPRPRAVAQGITVLLATHLALTR